jgi:hypothetical protein
MPSHAGREENVGLAETTSIGDFRQVAQSASVIPVRSNQQCGNSLAYTGKALFPKRGLGVIPLYSVEISPPL